MKGCSYLRKCPKCGNGAYSVCSSTCAYIKCSVCGFAISVEPTYSRACNVWNELERLTEVDKIDKDKSEV